MTPGAVHCNAGPRLTYCPFFFAAPPLSKTKRRSLFYSCTNPTNTSSFLTIEPPFDPLGPEVKSFVSATRALVASFNAQPAGVDGRYWIFYVTDQGGAVDALDSTEEIYQLFPIMIGL